MIRSRQNAAQRVLWVWRIYERFWTTLIQYGSIKMKYIMICLMLFCSTVSAEELYLNIHGASKHINSETQYNEKNQGIGVTWGDRWYYTAGGYNNSMNRTSIYLGGGYSKPVIQLDDFEVTAGVMAMVVSGYNVPVGLIVMLPTVAVGTPNVRILLGYVPKVTEWPAVITASIQVKLF